MRPFRTIYAKYNFVFFGRVEGQDFQYNPQIWPWHILDQLREIYQANSASHCHSRQHALATLSPPVIKHWKWLLFCSSCVHYVRNVSPNGVVQLWHLKMHLLATFMMSKFSTRIKVTELHYFSLGFKALHYAGTLHCGPLLPLFN